MRETINIEKIYDIMSQRLYNISLRIVGSSADAEEIMHDTLLQYWKFGSKHEIIDIGKWLSSICIRKSIDRLRERYRWKELLENYEDPILDEPEAENLEYDIQTVRKALSSLPDHYRAIVSLHLFEGYDYQEIAQITGANENTIRSLYMRGKQKLAAAMKKERP
jgi:RNA polymerase sigma-70 factor (ECF subfamily)